MYNKYVHTAAILRIPVCTMVNHLLCHKGLPLHSVLVEAQYTIGKIHCRRKDNGNDSGHNDLNWYTVYV